MTQADMDIGPGMFGLRTDAAVRSFQTQSALPSMGYYGPQTQVARAPQPGVPVSSPSSSSPGAVRPEKTAVVGAPLGDGTAEGALTSSKDQMPGGTLQG